MSRLGLAYDPEPGAGCFQYTNPSSDYRFYPTSLSPPRFFTLLQTTLDLLKPRIHYYLCKRGFSPWGGSNATRRRRSIKAHVHVLRALGVSPGSRSTLQFNMSQPHGGVALLYHLAMVCLMPEDDVYLIPDHGRQFAVLNHHDVLLIEFGNRRTVGRFVRRMAMAGFELPKTVPDETFHKPNWMKPIPGTRRERVRD